jgi:HK97 family phage prohead protease
MSAHLERRAFYDAKPREQRMSVGRVEARDAEDGGLTLAGYASITDAPYEVNDWLGTYSETIARGAFGKSLREADDVRLLVNHDGVPLARTKSGTLTLREVAKPEDDPQAANQTGLWCEASLDSASPLAQTVRSAMNRGDLSEMSFAFQATRQEWDADYENRTVREVRLFDVSVVTYPANPATSVHLNSADVAADIRELPTPHDEPEAIDLEARARALALARARVI